MLRQSEIFGFGLTASRTNPFRFPFRGTSRLFRYRPLAAMPRSGYIFFFVSRANGTISRRLSLFGTSRCFRFRPLAAVRNTVDLTRFARAARKA